MIPLKTGQIIKAATGEDIEVLRELGSGGQGIVYEVLYDNKNYALKWYTAENIINSDKFYKNLEKNVDKGAPTDDFLWPLILTERQKDGYGYIMEIRPPEYVSFTNILNAARRFSNMTAVINAAMNLAYNFRELHGKGYSYQDINDGNFFIDPVYGNILICDNDNVSEYGENLGIGGKSRYMAPEVVLGALPDNHTDRFSLAVVLFMLLFMSHPLEGAKTLSSPCLTEALERKFYGEEPIFIYDPDNTTNLPVRGVHNNAIKLWQIFPEYIKNAFIKTFTKGIADKENGRVLENEWLKLFMQLRDDMIICQCGREAILDASVSGVFKCPGCQKEDLLPLRLNIQKYSVNLYPGKFLYESHLKKDNFSFKQKAGEIIRNKNNPNFWGIRNLTDEKWIMKTPDGQVKEIGKGGVAPVLKGIIIDFGGQEAFIKG